MPGRQSNDTFFFARRPAQMPGGGGGGGVKSNARDSGLGLTTARRQ